MSYAEMFLLVWAVLATVLCGFVWSALRKALMALVGGAELVKDIAEGKAEVSIQADGSLKVERRK